MAEVYAGFSEYTDAQVGRIIDYLEQSGQLENTLIFYCADNGASGEGSPERVGQREQVLQRLARRDGGEPQAARRARQPEHLQPLPDRLGDRVLDAVPDVQALLVPGRHLRSAGHPLADGHQAPRARCATSTTTRSTSSRRSSSAVGLELPAHVQRARAGAAAGRVDEVLVRREPMRRRRRSASTTRCSARAASGSDGWKAVDGARPDIAASATSTTTSGSSSTPTRTAPRRTTSRHRSPSG